MIIDTKKVVAINSFCGYGRAALSNIIPIISVLGHQVCPIPTAVLSSHLGGFTKPYNNNIENSIENYIEHWSREDLKFDCIYVGYLGGNNNVDNIYTSIEKIKNEDCLVIVDPVMADNGSLYNSLNDNIIDLMRNLCKVADIITPNYTEACFLTNTPIKETINKKEVEELLEKLSSIKRGMKCIITSLPLEKNKIGIGIIDEEKSIIVRKKIDVSYPGTGDIFNSVLIGNILNGKSLRDSSEISADFILKCIEKAEVIGDQKRFGVPLESMLSMLL